MGTLGVQEMVVIFLLALVLFGPKKLPELGRTIGKALTEFRRASSDLKATFEREMQSLERENDSLKEVTHNAVKDIYTPPSFDYGDHQIQSHDPGHDVTASHHNTPIEATTTEHPSTVGASAVPGAESQGSTQTAVATTVHPPVEGTVPRSEEPEKFLDLV